MYRRFLCSFLLSLPLISLIASSPARACKRPAAGLSLDTSEVSEGGVLLLRWYCPEQPCVLQEIATALQVVDVSADTQVPVAGSVLRRGLGVDGHQAWAIFEPALPFVEGRRYAVSEAEMAPTYSFQAVAARAFDPALLTIAPTLLRDRREAGEPICCEPKESYNGSCGEQPCFAPMRQEQVVLQLAVGELTAGVGSWLYTTTYRAGEQTELVFGPQPTLHDRHAFELPAAQYCVKVEAQQVADETRTTLLEECFVEPTLALPLRAASEEEIAVALTACKVPPPGYEAAGRAAEELVVPETFPAPSVVAEPAAAEPSTVAPAAPAAPVPDAATPPAEVATADAEPMTAPEPAANDDARRAPKAVSGGCSIQPAGASPIQALSLLLGLRLWVRRRRKA